MSEHETAKIVAPPPVLFAVALGLGLALDAWAPLVARDAWPGWLRFGLGGGLAAANTGGKAVAFAGLWTAVLILGLLVAALTVSLERPWMRIALRVAGSWMAAIGVLAAGWVLQGFA